VLPHEVLKMGQIACTESHFNRLDKNDFFSSLLVDSDQIGFGIYLSRANEQVESIRPLTSRTLYFCYKLKKCHRGFIELLAASQNSSN
jgi:hypothetical protein